MENSVLQVVMTVLPY